MCLTTNPELINPLRFLREREIVHYQRFGECHEILQAMCIEPDPCDQIMAQTGVAGASVAKSYGVSKAAVSPAKAGNTNVAGAATNMAGAAAETNVAGAAMKGGAVSPAMTKGK